jgi:hypothetical protein
MCQADAWSVRRAVLTLIVASQSAFNTRRAAREREDGQPRKAQIFHFGSLNLAAREFRASIATRWRSRSAPRKGRCRRPLARQGPHIYPTLGEKQCVELTTEQIRKWHRGLARQRPTMNEGQQYRASSDDKDSGRRRRASANRVFTIPALKLLTNHRARTETLRDHSTDSSWRSCPPVTHAVIHTARVVCEPGCVMMGIRPRPCGAERGAPPDARDLFPDARDQHLLVDS